MLAAAVVDVHPLSCLDIGQRLANGQSIFEDVLALGDVVESILVAELDVLS
jgi:hypothetical protein